MTTQQKDVLINKIMIYISVAFVGTIYWYIMFSLMQSSLIITGYRISMVLAGLCFIGGLAFLLAKPLRNKMDNAPSYARMFFILTVLLLILWTPYVARSLSNFTNTTGISTFISRFHYLADIQKCARCTLIVGYVVVAIAIVVNVVLDMKQKKKQEHKERHPKKAR